MSWIAIGVVTAVMAVSAILQGAVGFGLGLIAIPFLIYLDLRFVPGPLLVAALTLHMLVLQRDRSGVDRSGLTMLLSGRVLGTIPAALLLASLPLDSMKILLAAVVLAGASMGMLHSGGHPTRAVLFGAGAASGFMATAAGLGGPPVALVYQRETGVRLRGTLAAYFIVGTVLSLIALAWAGRFGRRGNAAVCAPDSGHRARLLHVAAGRCVSRRRPHPGRGPHGLCTRSRQRHRDVLL